MIKKKLNANLLSKISIFNANIENPAWFHRSINNSLLFPTSISTICANTPEVGKLFLIKVFGDEQVCDGRGVTDLVDLLKIQDFENAESSFLAGSVTFQLDWIWTKSPDKDKDACWRSGIAFSL